MSCTCTYLPLVSSARGLNTTASAKAPYIEPAIFDFHTKKELMPGTSLHLSGHAFEAPISCVATSCRAKHVLLDLAISLCSCDLAVLRVL